MDQLLSLLQELCSLDGVSGCEDAVREALLRRLEGCCTCRVDRRGSLICTKSGARPASRPILLTAQMDEPGFLITHMEEDGLLRFAPAGKLDPRVVVGKPVTLESGVPGVVGTKPIHLQTASEKDTPVKLRELYIDIGASSREQAAKLVSLGDRAAFRGGFARLGQHKLCSKALDSRAACAVLVLLLCRQLPCDVTAVFAAQGESGGAAAASAAFGLNPHIALLLDAVPAAGLPGVDPRDQITVQGQGPAVALQDPGVLYDRALGNLALEVSRELDIPCQVKQGRGGSQAGQSLQSVGEGVRLLSLGLPVRYPHSPSPVVDLRDLESTLRLLPPLLERLAQAPQPHEVQPLGQGQWLGQAKRG